MKTVLRDFQHALSNGIDEAHASGARHVMAVSPTGSGKTVVMGAKILQRDAPTCAIAHRQELISQISLALNFLEIPHGIIAPDPVIRQIVQAHMITHGASFFNARSQTRVAGVDTLVLRDTTDRWYDNVQLAIVDEGHHVLAENKWGTALSMFPNAQQLSFTAHAVRADGKGLGRHADGLVDRLVLGPSCRALINRGLLADYRLVAAVSDVDLSHVAVSSTGEFSQPQVRKAIHESKTIVGDVVKHYLRYAAGKLGITFAVDIESAGEIARAYNDAGVPAQVITGKTDITMRAKLMQKFRRGELLQLVAVDVLSEGTDVPAVQVISMARPTTSFQLYAQQFGRGLRLMLPGDVQASWGSFTDQQRLDYIAASAKPKALIIDHVRNWERHAPLPDVARQYTLDRREARRSRGMEDAIPLKGCPECLQVYEAFHTACPHCGYVKAPAGRSKPEQVDGDLAELDPEVLRQLRGEITRVDGPVFTPKDCDAVVANSIRKRHAERKEAQAALRDAMALWGGWQEHQGRSVREGHKLFFLRYGIDVATACTLGAKDAVLREQRLRDELAANNIVRATP